MKRFKVTERMLEVVDDYMRPDGRVPADASLGLRTYFPSITEAQISKVIEKWRKEVRDAQQL